MSLRYLTGRLLFDLRHWLYSRRWFPLLRSHARGEDWLYDFCRLQGSREAGVVFDVGANVGQMSASLLQYFPDARLHAFELCSATTRVLARALTGHPLAQAHHLALAAQPGRIRVRLQEHSETNSLVFATDATDAGTEEVKISTIDLFCQAHGIDRVDVLKIDAQGSDLDVLRGAASLLAEGRIGCVYAEAGFAPQRNDLQDFASLDHHLTTSGFILAGIYEQWFRGPALVTFNVLYVHRSALRE